MTWAIVRIYVYLETQVQLENLRSKLIQRSGYRIPRPLIVKYAIRALEEHLDKYYEEIIKEYKEKYIKHRDEVEE